MSTVRFDLKAMLGRRTVWLTLLGLIILVLTAPPVRAEGLGGDVGDAPDSSNHVGSTMTTYPSAVTAKFPTVFDPAVSVPPGPFHWLPFDDAWLGPEVTVEKDADLFPDMDPVTNLEPAPNLADQDGFDDGVDPTTINLPVCGTTTFAYTMTVVGPTSTRFTNVWFDFNRDGDWEDLLECVDNSGNLIFVSEWAVRNQVTTLGPGFHTITTPLFNALGSVAVDDPLWMRITLSNSETNPIVGIPSQHDGRGPNNGHEFGETEDYLLHGGDNPLPCDPDGQNWEACHDTGDAPDSTNAFGLGMTTYPAGVVARYPSVYFGDPVPGPQHWMPVSDSWLGNAVTRELDADKYPQQEGVLNIDPPTNVADRDALDDGVDLSTVVIPRCATTTFDYTVTVVGPVADRFFNAWMDFNRDGDWEDTIDCIMDDGTTLQVSEWVVANEVLVLGPGVFALTTPTYAAVNLSTADDPVMWMRASLTEQPAPTVAVPSGSDGRGLAAGYEFGETEDYLVEVPPPPVDDCAVLYMSFHGDGVIDDVFYADEDIVKHDPCSGAGWSMHWDGTANGLPIGADIDGFTFLGNRIIMSFETTTVVGPTIAPEDLAIRMGGSYIKLLDGSTVGLGGEDIDAVSISNVNRLVVSLKSSASIPAANSCNGSAFNVDDEDLIQFAPSGPWPAPGGCWDLYYDGSNVGQDTTSFEDMWAAHVDAANGDIFQSSMWTYAVTGSSGDGTDVFVCSPSSLGAGTTACTFADFWDGNTYGVYNLSVDGVYVRYVTATPADSLAGWDSAE